jgi:hypothetical protein
MRGVFMDKKILKLKKLIYKEQKLILMLGLSATMAASASLASSESKKLESSTIKEEENDTLTTNNNDTLTAGVSSLLNYYLENENYGVSAGITRELTNIRTNSFYDKSLSIEEEEEPLEAASNPKATLVEEVEEEKIYYDFPCTEEFQDYIISVADKYDLPYEILFTIIHRESGGDWNTNGYISNTNDYGLCQINRCNLSDIYDALGYSEDDILNDPYKNVDASAYLLKGIFNVYGYTKDNFEYENVFGCYNGWTSWQKKKMARNYVNGCMEILEEKFSDLEEDTKREI